MNPYLIQRAKFVNGDDLSRGIDAIMRFDYMGSSEFEFGTLSKSLKEIRANLSDYVYIPVKVGNKDIVVFYNLVKCQGIQEYLNRLAGLTSDKPCLKERSAFDDYIKDDGYFKDKFDLWWDLENHLIFWKDNDSFLEKFKKVIFKGEAK
jgi:hypothetical protein